MLFRLALISILVLVQSQAISQDLVFKTKNIELLVHEWNNAHNTGNAKAFEGIYDQRLLFYTEQLQRKRAIEIKRELFESKADFQQRITTDFQYTIHPNGLVKCEFIKEIWENAEWHPYPAYLLLNFKKNRYWITGESDYTTDKLSDFVLDIGEPLEIEVTDTEADPELSESLSSGRKERSTFDKIKRMIPKKLLLIFLALAGAGGLIIFIGEKIRRRTKKKKFKPGFSIDYADDFQEETNYKSGSQSKEYEQTKFPQQRQYPLKTPGAAASERQDRPIPKRREEPEPIQKQDVQPPPPVIKVETVDTRTPQVVFKDYLTMILKSSSFVVKGVKENSLAPGEQEKDTQPIFDFEFNDEGKTTVVAIQTLYVQDPTQPEIPLFSEATLRFNEQFSSQLLYYVIGLAGPPAKPFQMFLIPAKELHATSLGKEALKRFRKSGMFVFYNGKLL